MTTLLQGTKVGEFVEDQRFFDVVVWGAPEARAERRSRSGSCALRRRAPGPVPLSAVADVIVAPMPNEITRENGSRRIDVTLQRPRSRSRVGRARHRGAARGHVARHAAITRKCSASRSSAQASSRRLLMWGALSFVAIFLLLLIDFGSLRLTLLVFLTLPFALVGAIAAAFLSGGVLSLGSLVGLVTVIGIAARNGIMLVSHYRHLETRGRRWPSAASSSSAAPRNGWRRF